MTHLALRVMKRIDEGFFHRATSGFSENSQESADYTNLTSTHKLTILFVYFSKHILKYLDDTVAPLLIVFECNAKSYVITIISFFFSAQQIWTDWQKLLVEFFLFVKLGKCGWIWTQNKFVKVLLIAIQGVCMRKP